MKVSTVDSKVQDLLSISVPGSGARSVVATLNEWGDEDKYEPSCTANLLVSGGFRSLVVPLRDPVSRIKHGFDELLSKRTAEGHFAVKMRCLQDNFEDLDSLIQALSAPSLALHPMALALAYSSGLMEGRAVGGLPFLRPVTEFYLKDIDLDSTHLQVS